MTLTLAQACDPVFWEDLVPTTTFPSMHHPMQGTVAAGTIDLEGLRLRAEGYARLDEACPGAGALARAACCMRLAAEEIPSVFAFVYPAFWELRAALRAALTAWLGAGYRQLPDFWIWVRAAKASTSVARVASS
jgi:hypothetical protein